jgi:hypothetical protein
MATDLRADFATISAFPFVRPLPAKPGIDGQIGRAFGRNRRMTDVVANLAQVYFLSSGKWTERSFR